MYLALTVFLIIIFIAVLLVWVYLCREVFNPGGKGASKKTARILSQFAMLRGFKVLSDVKLNDADGEFKAENILVGYFGLLLVRTLGARGEYYGTMDAENWSFISSGKKDSFTNPMKLFEREKAALRAIFAKNEIYNVPIEHVVYMSNASSKTSVFITHSGEVLLSGKLGAYLNKTKFERDAGIDVKKITEAVLSVC